MRKWWRGLPRGRKGGIVYLAVALTFNFGGIALVEIFDWPGWMSGVFIITGIVLGVAAGFLTYTLGSRRKRQPRERSVRHNRSDRNCLRWNGDYLRPVDLSQRCLHCNPKSPVRVITRHDEDNWYEDDEDLDDDYDHEAMRVIQSMRAYTEALRRRGR